MEQTISRYEVLQAIDTGQPFDLVFLTADRRRGTGGTIKRVSHYVKITAADQQFVPDQVLKAIGIRSTGSTARNPNHREHRTFNIYNPNKPAEHAYKVHWRLMVFFNGKRIIQ